MDVRSILTRVLSLSWPHRSGSGRAPGTGRPRRWGCITAALCSLAAACGGPDGAESPDLAADTIPTLAGGPAGGTLVVLMDGEPDNLNPLTYASLPAHQAVRLIFRGLARRDSTLSGYQPDLATSWELGPDSVATIRIRDDVRWHDGAPVTADDVAFTIELQRNREVASPRQADVAAVESVTVVDSTTLRLKLNRTGVYTLNSLLEVVPVPRHLLADAAPADLRLAPFSRNPVGNGFYRFGRWESGQQLVLEANRDVPEGRPALDRIVMRVVPDLNAALTEVLAGQADLLKVPADLADRVEQSGIARLHGAPRVRLSWIAWNTDRAPLDQREVRRAILMAVDRERIVRGLFGEQGEASFSPIPTALWEHSTAVRPIPYDPGAARELLDSAGWRDSNGDGVRERAGVPLRVQVDYISAEQVRQDVLVAMQSMLREVGVDLVPRAYERTAWLERLRGREFQGSSWGWGWGPGVAGPNAEMVFHSRSIPPAGANFAGYANPEVDRLIDSVLVVQDSARLQSLWGQLEQLLVDDAVYAPIYLDPELFAVHSRFDNVRFRGLEWWEDVSYWYIPPDRRLPRDRTR